MSKLRKSLPRAYQNLQNPHVNCCISTKTSQVLEFNHMVPCRSHKKVPVTRLCPPPLLGQPYSSLFNAQPRLQNLNNELPRRAGERHASALQTAKNRRHAIVRLQLSRCAGRESRRLSASQEIVAARRRPEQKSNQNAKISRRLLSLTVNFAAPLRICSSVTISFQLRV